MAHRNHAPELDTRNIPFHAQLSATAPPAAKPLRAGRTSNVYAVAAPGAPGSREWLFAYLGGATTAAPRRPDADCRDVTSHLAVDSLAVSAAAPSSATRAGRFKHVAATLQR